MNLYLVLELYFRLNFYYLHSHTEEIIQNESNPYSRQSRITKVKPNKRLIKFLLIQILAAALRYNIVLNMKPVKRSTIPAPPLAK